MVESSVFLFPLVLVLVEVVGVSSAELLVGEGALKSNQSEHHTDPHICPGTMLKKAALSA